MADDHACQVSHDCCKGSLQGTAPGCCHHRIPCPSSRLGTLHQHQQQATSEKQQLSSIWQIQASSDAGRQGRHSKQKACVYIGGYFSWQQGQEFHVKKSTHAAIMMRYCQAAHEEPARRLTCGPAHITWPPSLHASTLLPSHPVPILPPVAV